MKLAKLGLSSTYFHHCIKRPIRGHWTRTERWSFLLYFKQNQSRGYDCFLTPVAPKVSIRPVIWRGAWVAQSVKCLPSTLGYSPLWERPCSAEVCFSLSCPSSSTCALSLAFSFSNKILKKKEKKKEGLAYRKYSVLSEMCVYVCVSCIWVK